jgi:mono/diheme cytochrome c family protein
VSNKGTQDTGAAGTETLVNIQTVDGGSGFDTLIGDTAANYLIGGAGNDTLIGGTGAANTLQGGTGDDHYVVQAAGDSVVEFANEGINEVQTFLASSSALSSGKKVRTRLEDLHVGPAFVSPQPLLILGILEARVETGIGKYTDQEFLDAMHRGIPRDGARLYPAMPYTSYTFVTDADALAIKAYLFSLTPVRAVPPANTLWFPFNQRWAMTFWSVVFNPDTPDKTAGLGGWSDDEIASYLSTGHVSGRGTASGPMGEAVDHSFSKMTRADIEAMVTFLRSVPAAASGFSSKAVPAPVSHKDGMTASLLGKKIYGWSGERAVSKFSTLTGTAAVNDPSAMNVAQIVISGTRRLTPEDALAMPSFGHAFSDDEIAAVVNYVTARFGARGSSLTARDIADLRAQN